MGFLLKTEQEDFVVVFSNNEIMAAKALRLVLSMALLVLPLPSYADSVFVSALPAPGVRLQPSAPWVPALARGLRVYPGQPLNFSLIVDSGQESTDLASVRAEGRRFAEYFLAALTVPEEQLWVNLSPLENERRVEPALGQTVLGRDLLAQDYVLKEFTSSLLYPETEPGRSFWERVYREAQAMFGTTDIPLEALHKVWVAPARAEVYETAAGVFITQSRLKVMLDIDKAGRQDVLSDEERLGRNIYRDIIVPIIEQEVNDGAHFAVLRQIYQAVILAKWYRKALSHSSLNEIYINKNQVSGVEAREKTAAADIYQRYKEAFAAGVFNYVREDMAPAFDTLIPRKYFSGGTDFRVTTLTPVGRPAPEHMIVGEPFKIDFAMQAILGNEGNGRNSADVRTQGVIDDIYSAGMMAGLHTTTANKGFAEVLATKGPAGLGALASDLQQQNILPVFDNAEALRLFKEQHPDTRAGWFVPIEGLGNASLADMAVDFMVGLAYISAEQVQAMRTQYPDIPLINVIASSDGDVLALVHETVAAGAAGVQLKPLGDFVQGDQFEKAGEMLQKIRQQYPSLLLVGAGGIFNQRFDNVVSWPERVVPAVAFMSPETVVAQAEEYRSVLTKVKESQQVLSQVQSLYPQADWQALADRNQQYWRQHAAAFEKGKTEDPQPGWFFESLLQGLDHQTEILELGMGSGRAMKMLLRQGYTHLKGMDVSAKALQMANGKKGLPAERLINGDITQEPLPGTFDVIFANDLFLYFNPLEMDAVLRKVRAGLSAGGRLGFRWAAAAGDRVEIMHKNGKAGNERWAIHATEMFIRTLMRLYGFQLLENPRLVKETINGGKDTIDFWYCVAAKIAPESKERAEKTVDPAMKGGVTLTMLELSTRNAQADFHIADDAERAVLPRDFRGFVPLLVDVRPLSGVISSLNGGTN